MSGDGFCVSIKDLCYEQPVYNHSVLCLDIGNGVYVDKMSYHSAKGNLFIDSSVLGQSADKWRTAIAACFSECEKQKSSSILIPAGQ